MAHRLTFWDVRLAWSHSWGSGQSSLFWYVTWARTLLLEQTPWDPYCLTRWTSSMDYYLRKEVCLSNYIVETQHYLDASLLWGIVRFRHILRWSFTVLPARWVAGLCHPVACWRAWLFFLRTQAWWWVGRWWTLRDGRFRYWCRTLVRKQSWWSHFRRLAWLPRCRRFSPLWTNRPILCVILRYYQNIYRDYWTGPPATWTIHREAGWRIHYCSLWICSPCRALLWLATRMLWNTPSILGTAHLFAALQDVCLPRRSNKKKLVLRRCWPVVKSNRATVRGQHRWS